MARARKETQLVRFTAGDAIHVLRQYWKRVVRPELVIKGTNANIIKTGDFIHSVMFGDKLHDN